MPRQSSDKKDTFSEKVEEDTWAQTLLTITPEDDAVLREIKPLVTVSAPARNLLDLYTDSFAYRRPLTPKYLVDPREMEDESIRQMHVQTYLQGVPVVDIPTRYKDQNVQTVYMSSPCPPEKYFTDVMTSMRDGPIPEMKHTRESQTILMFRPDLNQQTVADQLMIDTTKECNIIGIGYVCTITEYMQAEEDAMVLDVLRYIEERAFWILDPTTLSYTTMIEKHTQTSIRYNQNTGTIVVDNETQTGLTCEPKSSNTELLADYHVKKSMVKDILDECVDNAIESRLVAVYIIDEIMEKCADRVKFPFKDQDIQTLASYKIHENKDDILRKLQLPVVVDPLEASIVVLPLMSDLLTSVYDVVVQNAHRVTKYVLHDALEKSLYIGSRIDEIRSRTHGESFEKILDKRRKKLEKLMTKKKTQTVFTQTSISGIDKITKLEEPKESYSCLCLKGSTCLACLSMKKEKSLPGEMKMMRTEDILLAYKPYPEPYPVSSRSQKTQIESPTKRLEQKSVMPRSKISDYSSGSDSTATIEVVLKPKDRLQLKDSIEGWTRAIDAALTIPWSPQSSLSDTDKARTCSKSSNGITLQTLRVLQILKSTFCIKDTCPMSVVEKLKRSYDEEVDFDKSSIRRDACQCSIEDHLCMDVKNLPDDSTIDTETYDTSIENTECLCHVSYTLNTWQRPSRNTNNSRKVKIIPIQFSSTT